MDLGDIWYFYYQKQLLLRNIPKIGCQITGICYNKCVGYFMLRIVDVNLIIVIFRKINVTILVNVVLCNRGHI